MQPEESNSVIFNGITRRRLWELLGTACVFLLAPLIVIALIFLYIYRRSVEIALRIQLRSKFAGLLKGADCVWAVEDVSLSVVNILMILEKAARDSNAIFLEAFRNLINERIVSKAAGTTLEKLFYLRSQKFGYYFWERSEKVDLKDRIRWLECVNANCDGSCEDISSESFRKTLENVCNRPLPEDHRAAWEILVGRRCPRSRSHVEEGRLCPEECFNTDIRKIPVLFRVHHSLGDGVALLGLLLKTIAEEDGGDRKEARVKIKSIASSDETEERFKEIVPALHNSQRSFQHGTDVVRFYEKNILAASMPFTYVTFSRIVQDLRNHFRASSKLLNNVTIESLRQQAKMSIERISLSFKVIVLKQLYGRIKEVTRLTMALLSFPKFFVQQAVRSMDENALHGPPQTGEKIMFYRLDNVTNEKSLNLLMKIREIRKNTGAKFEDVILAAFSASVYKYHLRIQKTVPDTLTAILPIRMAMPDENLTLDNKFSIALLRICISNVNGQTIESSQDSQFFKRLQDITRANNELRKSSDILLNYWFMKYLSALLPVKMLKASLLSHSTMAFSNMRGPEKVRILNNSLSNIAFWIPNKSTTALGLSLFSYGGNLQLSLIADKSIVKDETLLTELLENTVHEIETAHNHVVLMRLLKPSVFPIETSAENDIGVFQERNMNN
ncbi:PREDICTED: uncharacterized protein LOC105450689 [Wasmannia auropunctata]|uniref:uncharacterized protein LOC105450689 n=1 Tax=Wasmannia auropunctata TaxID=64793 RepID=UPI0005ED4CAC|nr:PREDICTED: uncharacterized protein LOC105450689 [Wasmannia auropunctata]XP_011688942.1 PREDICTED: uncharacterized protein LOC105450689 [Wasmannia auropunctata]